MSEFTPQEIQELHQFAWEANEALKDDPALLSRLGGNKFADALTQYFAEVYMLNNISPEAWFASPVRQGKAETLRGFKKAYDDLQEADSKDEATTEEAKAVKDELESVQKQLAEALTRVEKLEDRRENQQLGPKDDHRGIPAEDPHHHGAEDHKHDGHQAHVDHVEDRSQPGPPAGEVRPGG